VCIYEARENKRIRYLDLGGAIGLITLGCHANDRIAGDHQFTIQHLCRRGDLPPENIRSSALTFCHLNSGVRNRRDESKGG